MLRANMSKARVGGKDINVPAPPKATRINAGEWGWSMILLNVSFVMQI